MHSSITHFSAILFTTHISLTICNKLGLFLLVKIVNRCTIKEASVDFFSLGGLFSITDDVIFPRGLFFYPRKIYSFIHTRLFENLKARILKRIITWSVMGQQTAQAKKGLLFLYFNVFLQLFLFAL